MSESGDSVRREVHFSGRVQGVGFRYTTREIARRFRVTGFVQNLHDGRVLLVAEGSPPEIDQFVAALSSEMADHIHGQNNQELPATGEFTRFEIRR